MADFAFQNDDINNCCGDEYCKVSWGWIGGQVECLNIKIFYDFLIASVEYSWLDVYLFLAVSTCCVASKPLVVLRVASHPRIRGIFGSLICKKRT